MKPSELLAHLAALRERIDSEPVSFSSQVESKLLANILDSYHLKIQYENMKLEAKVRPIELLENGEPPFSDEEKKMVMAASAVHWQIVELLGGASKKT